MVTAFTSYTGSSFIQGYVVMKSGNYVVIQGWMCNELNLKGNELLAFALLYGFSQDGESSFNGGRNYIANTFNISLPTVDKAIEALKTKGLITVDKAKNGKISYKVSLSLRGKETLPDEVKKLYPTGKETLPNNNSNKQSIFNNIDLKNKKDNNFEFGKSRQPKQNLYNLCIANIYNFTTNTTIQRLLIDFLDSLIEMNRLRGQKQFVGILNKLNQYGNTDDQKVKIIEYTIEKGYSTFYDLKDNRPIGKKASSDMGRKVHRMTAEQKKQFKEDIASGKAEKY